MAASLSRVRPLTNPSAWISSNCSVRSRWSTKRPVSKIRSWLKLNLCTYTERRGIAGTIEARTAESEIMPLRLAPRREHDHVVVARRNGPREPVGPAQSRPEPLERPLELARRVEPERGIVPCPRLAQQGGDARELPPGRDTDPNGPKHPAPLERTTQRCRRV